MKPKHFSIHVPGAQPHLDMNHELVRPRIPIGTLGVCTEQVNFGCREKGEKVGYLQQINDPMTLKFSCNIKIHVSRLLNSSLAKYYRDELEWYLMSHLQRNELSGEGTSDSLCR